MTDQKPGKAVETTVEVTLSGARDLKNTKVFGKMSPCATVAIANTNLTQVSEAATSQGTSPAWNQTLVFQVPDAVLGAQDPKPSVRVEIFDSSDLNKSLGLVTIPLARPIAEYDHPYQTTLGVLRKGKVRGFLNFSVKCGRTSFAPPKGTPEYDAFVRRLIPPPPAPQAQAYRAPAPAYPAAAYPPPGYPGQAYPAAGGYPPPGYQAAYHHPYPHPQTVVYGAPPPYGYPPGPYGAPPQQVVVVENRNRGMGGMGGGGMGGAGMGVGLMAGAAGGLLLGAALTDGFGGCGGGCGGF